jgi:hypothetical protein
MAERGNVDAAEYTPRAGGEATTIHPFCQQIASIHPHNARGSAVRGMS